MDDLRRQAEEHFRRGNQLDEQGERERAIQEWLTAIDCDSEHTGAHYNLGIAYAEEGDYERAIQQLREVIRLDSLDTEARRILAEILIEQDQTDQAIDQLRQVLNLDPHDHQAIHLLTQTYLDLEMWDQAAATLEMGGIAEEDADLWFELGMVYEMQQHRLDDAILAYRRALIARPDHPGAARALRRLQVPLEELDDEEEFEK